MWQMLIPAVTSIIDKVIPDPQAAADAKLKALDIAQRGEFAELQAAVDLAKGQMSINKEEAASPSFFRGGWRPATGWVCVAGLGYTFLLRPLLPWLASVAGLSVPELPPLDTDELMALLTGMLGLGGYRTVERIKGKA